MEITIELMPHVGMTGTPLGPVEVHIGQWIVKANGVHVGFIGMGPQEYHETSGISREAIAAMKHIRDDQPFNGTLQLGAMPVGLQEQIVAAVEKKLGRSVKPRIPINYAEVESAEEADDYDDDDDGESDE